MTFKTDWSPGQPGHAAEHNNISRRLNEIISVSDFGARGGDNDDTTAIQNALNAIIDADYGGTHLVFPHKTYRVTDTLTATRPIGLTIEGAGAWSSIIKWEGAAGKPVLRLYNAGYTTIQNLGIFGNSDPLKRPSHIIEVQGDLSDPLLKWPPSLNTFRNLFLGGASNHMADYGIAYTLASGSGDGNNDQGRLERVSIQHCDIGFYNQHGNGFGHTLTGCQFLFGNRAVHMQAGTFQMRDCYIGDMSEVDIYCYNLSGSVVIQGNITEHGQRFLQWENATGNNGWPMTIEGNRIATAHEPSTREVIAIRQAGPTIIRGNNFLNGGNPPPYIYVQPGSQNSVVTIEDNVFDNPGAAEYAPNIYYPANNRTKFKISGNLYRKPNTEMVATDGVRTITSAFFTIPVYMDGWLILLNYAGGCGVTLPIQPVANCRVTIKDITANLAAPHSIVTSGDGKIDEQDTMQLSGFKAVTFVSDGVDWFTV